MGTKQLVVREYNFSDAELKKNADSIIGNVQRDAEQFAVRGVSDEKIAQVQAKVVGFGDIPTDVELLGAVSAATLNKDTVAENVRVNVRSVRTMAQNCHGAKSPLYRSFGFEGMDTLSDGQLYFLGKRVLREATAQMGTLAAEGLTDAVLGQLQISITDLDNCIQAKQLADKERDVQTQIRINAGNALYREIVRFCNTGKDIWASTDPARYNDYLIYSSPSAAPANAGINDGKGEG